MSSYFECHYNNSNHFCRVRLRRSNTLGRVDTHSQAQALRRPLPTNQTPIQISPSNLIGPLSIFQLNKSNPSTTNSPAKMEEVIVCIECKKFIEETSIAQQQQQQQQQQQSDDDDNVYECSDSQDEEVVEVEETSRERRFRKTKSMFVN